jgi:hypothetical protein
MARVSTIIVGGGIGAGTPFTVNGLTFVSVVDPPQIATTDFLTVVATGVNRGLIVGASDPGAGPERLRVNGGSILRGSHAATTVIGDATVSGGINQIVIGDGITAPGTAAGVLIGVAAVGSSTGTNVIIGNGASLVGAGTVIGGTSAAAGSNVHIVIGGASSGNANQNHINIGATCSVTTGVTIISQGGTVSGLNSTGIGGAITLAAPGAIGIGGSVATAGHTNSIVIGNGASSFAAQQFLVGSNASATPINTFCIGHGLDTTGNPTAVLIRLTNGSGADNTAGALTCQAGLSTGNIVGPGVNLDAGIPAGSSSTVQTARTWVSARPTTTAADTGIMVWDVNGAALKRVSVGANDSGGAGFKLLRIAN